MLSFLVEPSNSGKRQTGETGEGGVGKTLLVFGVFFLFTSALQKCLHSCRMLCVFFPLYFSPSSVLPSNSLTAPTERGAFLTSCCLTLSSLSESDTLMATKWFINKWFCLAEMYHSTSFTLLSYHSSLELRVTTLKHKHARMKPTYIYFSTAAHKNSSKKSVSKTEQVCLSLTLEQTDCYLSHVLLIHSNVL